MYICVRVCQNMFLCKFIYCVSTKFNRVSFIQDLYAKFHL